jgi:hypothetical protein
MTAPKDPIKCAEWKRKIGESKKGNKYNLGKHRSEATRGKISESMGGKNLGKHHTEETKTHMSEIRKGNKNWLGKHRSEETKRKLSEANKGEKSHLWKGGISFAPYCQKFNNEFKERVREFFGRECVECGAPEEDNGERLNVHHVNFRKDACCAEDVTPLFVTLCRSCHAKTSHNNRVFWEFWFTELINHQYGGKCYLTKEEVGLL